MKNRLIGITAAALVLSLSACASDTTQEATDNGSAASTESSLLTVANVVSGTLGDSGFFDDAEKGMVELQVEGHQTTTLQAEVNNPAQWKSNLESVSTGNWDIAIVGTFQMQDILIETAAKYPEQKFIIYDAPVEAPNVASIVYKQNEAAFLAGVLAATATSDTTSFPLSSGSKKVGLVGGMDIPVINDFLYGFRAGVEAVDPSIEVLVSYVGSFNDSAKGYDQGKAMFDQGADVVFQVAGGAGLGALQAAKDANKYGIGVDSNQNDLQPGHVLASSLKNIGNSLVTAVNAAQEGTLDWGSTTAYGLSNDGVGLDYANNGNTVPQAVQDLINQFKQDIIDGKITVPTTLG